MGTGCSCSFLPSGRAEQGDQLLPEPLAHIYQASTVQTVLFGSLRVEKRKMVRRPKNIIEAFEGFDG